MVINMQYCRVRNVLAAVRELNEQLQECSGLSEAEWLHLDLLVEETEELITLLGDTYKVSEDE